MVLRGRVEQVRRAGRVDGHVLRRLRIEPIGLTHTCRIRRYPTCQTCPTCQTRPTRLSYCTFAVTDAVPFSVNVQLFDLLFEHAPEKTASRPLPTVNVIEVPTVNDAVFVDPLITSRPPGVDVT